MAQSLRKPVPAGHVVDTSLVGIKIHQGPLPAPTDFAAYEHVHTGAANRLLAMAERDQEARIHDLRFQRLIKFTLDLLSQLFLYSLVAAAVYLALHDKPLEAFFAGLAPIAATIYANIRKNASTSNEQNSSTDLP